MMRRAIALLATPLLFAACYGEMESTQPAGERFEGVPIDPNVDLTCLDPVTNADDGYHNPGAACLGCHDGNIGPAFTAAGTLYADENGTTPLSGFSVSIIDADDKRIEAISGANGNFYAVDTFTFPAVALVSACPDVVPMPIQLTVADCNSCHVSGDRVTFSP